MRRSFIPALILILALNPAPDGQAQSMVVKTSDGMETIRPLNTLEKIHFNDNSLIVSCSDGSNDAFELTAVRKIYFKSGSSGVGSIPARSDEQKITAYPNPAGETLMIGNLPEGFHSVVVYKINGLLVQRDLVKTGGELLALDVSSLKGGLYFLKV